MVRTPRRERAALRGLHLQERLAQREQNGAEGAGHVPGGSGAASGRIPGGSGVEGMEQYRERAARREGAAGVARTGLEACTDGGSGAKASADGARMAVFLPLHHLQ